MSLRPTGAEKAVTRKQRKKSPVDLVGLDPHGTPNVDANPFQMLIQSPDVQHNFIPATGPMDVDGLSGNDKTLNAHNEDEREGNAPKPVGDHPSDAAQAEPDAKITDPHPDKTAGGVLQWVVNVERPSPYALLSDKGSNAFLKMSRNQDLPWKNVQQFNKSIDSMPHVLAGFKKEIKVQGNRGNAYLGGLASKFYARHLPSSWKPAISLYMRYAPVRSWTLALQDARIYSEMWTGDWWWQMQNILGKGATICPVILASNKTQLTTLSGGCQAWPVYLMIGNISKRICRRPGEGASLLVGYIPADSLETCYSKEDKRREARWKLFHKAMELIVWPFAEVSCKGKEVVCANGGVRRVHQSWRRTWAIWRSSG
ncbi:Zn-finger protein [Rhizoctonia solani]|uniref:Zn-finger protein n=1 Tax=Rhizoctonia solani TaxID=456999 RepID=A0A8H7I381_9AGAM|nr:Zn-finger protein [Rhizoctonia solani]